MNNIIHVLTISKHPDCIGARIAIPRFLLISAYYSISSQSLSEVSIGLMK
jgi:hypothetical protein